MRLFSSRLPGGAAKVAAGLVAAAVLLAGGLYAAGSLSSASQDDGTPPEAEALLERVSATSTQGWLDDQRPQPALEERYGDGKRLFVTCGTVSTLAQNLLADEGVDSRLVTTLTTEPLNGLDDGHTMLEVRDGGDWVLYDLINNRVAVDADGENVGLVDQLRAGEARRWRVLSDDKLLDFRAAPPGAREVTIETYVNEGIDAWYDRVLGTPAVETAPGSGEFVFGDAERERRLEGYSPAYRLVDPAEWQRRLEG